MNNQISKKRQLTMLLISTSIIAIFATLVTSPTLTAAAVHDNGNQKSKDVKSKNPKCNNVQILLKVSKIPKDSKLLVVQATLDGKTLNKKQHVEGDNKVAIPLLFKKLNPCPVVGDSFSGSVNSTSFSGTLTSLKKPNKVNVALS